MYIGHRTEEGKIQLLKEHLEETAEIAARFALSFNARDLAWQTGLAHDIGKYAQKVQKRLLGEGQKVDHSTAGAIEILPFCGYISAYCIAGHHGGLPNGGSKYDMTGESTLRGRIKQKPGKELPDYRCYEKEIAMKRVKFPELKLTKGVEGFCVSFFIRMLFSCLVDADFLNTERFMSGGKVNRENDYDSIPTLLEHLQAYIEPWWKAITKINQKRCEVLQACIDCGHRKKGLYTLTVPTGGGKTVSSLAFALTQAKNHHMERVIYVIPYTSIIEQNAGVFKSIVGEKNVLEHHANISYDSNDTEEDVAQMEYKRLACENWDAPIIVTTNVQFFESLFANKTSRCRKLHNIANSVIIFDEAQMIPLPYLQPCVQAMSELVINYGCSIVLCTATQPSIQKLFPETMSSTEIYPDTEGLFEFFRRTRIEKIGALSDETIAQHLCKHTQVLCIVNNRRQAQNLYALLKDAEGCFHLSTYMAPVHRSRTLAEIRTCLKEGRACRVVATSLIEAGVDVDFPVVFRAQAGLDSEIQAAGRCNREGERDVEQSIVYIFIPEQRYFKRYPATLKTPIAMEQEIAEEYDDITSSEAIKSYFDRLHAIKGERLDEKKILREFQEGYKECSFPFKQIASIFKLIEEDTRMILIPLVEDGAADVERRLREGEHSRALLREAGQYSVNVYKNQFNALINSGKLEILDEQIAILIDQDSYSSQTGLCITVEEGIGIFA